VAGAVLTAANLNSLRDVLNFWAGPPQCYAYLSSATTTTTSVWLVVGLQSEMFDVVQSGDSPSHDNATNSSRIYFRTPGKYEVSGQITFAANSTGTRQAQLKLNAGGVEASGTQLFFTVQGAVAGGVQTSVPIIPFAVTASAGDYIEVFAMQTSGGNLDLTGTAGRTFLRTRLVST
jgi:hypothetical protein